MRRLAVVKFGGTCLGGSRERELSAGRCAELLEEFERLVVVVSAMGRQGDPYATDSLLGLAPEATPAERDSLMACGELISAAVMAAHLRRLDIPARALSGPDAGIVTDGVEGDSRIECVYLEPLSCVLEESRVAVVAGFQGQSRQGRITTLGRGGSDSTALALASALEADEAILFKTVEAVYTADPDTVPGSRPIRRISAEDLRQMAWQGAKVVHPRAAEISAEAGVPIQVRSLRSGGVVTEIAPCVLDTGRYISGVASGPEVTQVRVFRKGAASRAGFFATVFGKVADAGISMDMFTVLDGTAVFTVASGEADRVEELLRGSGRDLAALGPCSKVSIVGAGMHGMHGVMARFSGALAAEGIDMLQTVDSHATISALVRLGQRDRAVRALHREFLEDG
jgi:aspartate kinase